MKAKRYIATGIATALFGLGSLGLSSAATAADNSMSHDNDSMSSGSGGMSHENDSMSSGSGGGMSHDNDSMSSGSGGGMSHENGSMSSGSGGGMSHENGNMSSSMPKSKVRSVQMALKQNGANITADGIMGPKTSRALRHYQQQNGLKATGHPDHKTLKSLGVASGSSMQSHGSMSEGSSMSEGNSQ